MLNWDDPLNSVQNNNNSDLNSQNEASLKVSAINVSKDDAPTKNLLGRKRGEKVKHAE